MNNSECRHIATLNAGGISRKKTAVDNFLVIDKIDILGLTEIKKAQLPNFRNFNGIHRRSQLRSKDGRDIRGVALLIKNDLRFTEHKLPNQLEHLECIAADVEIDFNLTVSIFCLYNPPEEDLPLDLFSYAANIRHSIILGDFNARHRDFGDTTTDRYGRLFMSALQSFNLFRLLNDKPTFINHNGWSIIDHIVISEALSARFLDESIIGTTITSDHMPVISFFKSSKTRKEPPQRLVVRDTRNTDWNKFKQLIELN